MKYAYKKICIMTFCFILTLGSTFPCFAEDLDWDDYTCVSEESILLPPNQTKSREYYRNYKRGNLMAACDLSISNDGGGRIGVYAQTLCYVPVDRVRMRIYLDQWLPDENRWAMVNYYDYDFLSSQEPDGILDMPSVSFNILKEPTGYYYRLRGLHVIYLGNQSEACSTETDGVLITKDGLT